MVCIIINTYVLITDIISVTKDNDKYYNYVCVMPYSLQGIFIHNTSFTTDNNPVRWVSLCSHFTDAETEAKSC